MKGNVWQVAVLAIALALLFPALNIGFGEAAQDFSVGNEPDTIDYSVNSSVDTDAWDYDDLNVTHEPTNTLLDEGTDYNWYSDSGTIEWLNSSSTTDGDEVTLSYEYDQHTQDTENVEGALAPISPVMTLLLLIAVIGTIFAWTAIGMDGGGGF